ncbi:hypothetical protein SKAU_G00300800 [Synaphobranchus kaupii]|uniref:Uncharacterized protein n=1 Tax=Synaphobranchus kaupii TaxID=118154 RepID=A0A9Q1EVR5_SYNKA|nr:hypothetical protein SKAU_G00300800 [Synaphobranchus kaupii]
MRRDTRSSRASPHELWRANSAHPSAHLRSGSAFNQPRITGFLVSSVFFSTWQKTVPRSSFLNCAHRGSQRPRLIPLQTP